MVCRPMWLRSGEAYFSIVLNSFVHVLMYGYYFGATFGWLKREADAQSRTRMYSRVLLSKSRIS